MCNWLKITTLTIGFAFCCCAMAQQHDKVVHRHTDRSFLLDHAWLWCSNPAGITDFDVEKTAAAEVSALANDGAFHSFSEPETKRVFTARTDAFLRLGAEKEASVLHGAVSYQRSNHLNQSGSVFLTSSEKPFDLIPLDTFPSQKKLERYNLMGRFARPCGAWTLGATIDFTSANYAKLRDLRHTNSYLDLDVAAGATRQLGNLLLGLSLNYRRQVEGVEFDVYGVQDRPYYVLVSSGLYWGFAEEATSRLGYAQTTNELPLFDQLHGAAVQLSGNVGVLHCFAELAANRRRGQFGLQSATTAVFTQHEGFSASAQLSFALAKEKTLQRLDIEFSSTCLDNYAKLHRLETDDSRQQRVRYYGRQRTLESVNHNFCTDYRLYLGADSLLSQWVLSAKYQLSSSNKKAMQSVEYKTSRLLRNEIGVGACRNIHWKRNLLKINLQTATQFASGEPCKVSFAAATPAEISKFVQLETPLLCDYGFATATAFCAKIEVEYRRSFALFAIGLKTHYERTQAEQQPNLAGNSRNAFGVALVCQF